METIITALNTDKLSAEEYEKVASYILEQIETVKTHSDLLLFLQNLTSRWNIFTFVLHIENGEVKKIQEEQALAQVQELTRNGQFDQALSLAKSATETPPVVVPQTPPSLPTDQNSVTQNPV